MPAHIISSEEQRDRMLCTPIPKLIVSLSIPTLASQLISVFYNTADTYFVSKLSTSASAAVGVVFSLMSIIQAFGFGIGMGCGSIISRSLGSRDNEQADRTASSAFFLPPPWGFSSALRGSARPAAHAPARLNGNDPPVLGKLRAHHSAGRACHVRVVRAEQHAALRGRGDALHVRHLCGRPSERRARPAVHLCLRHGHRGRGAGHGAQPADQLLHPRVAVPPRAEHRPRPRPLHQQTARTLRRNSARRLPDDLPAGLRKPVLCAFK